MEPLTCLIPIVYTVVVFGLGWFIGRKKPRVVWGDNASDTDYVAQAPQRQPVLKRVQQ